MKNWQQFKHKLVHRKHPYRWTQREVIKIERFNDERTLIRVQCKVCGAWWYELL